MDEREEQSVRWKRFIKLLFLGLLLASAWCSVLAICVIVLLDVLQLIGPVSLVGLVGLPFVAIGGLPLLFWIARIGLHGLENAHHLIQISPYLPPDETAQALRDSLRPYRACRWSDLLEKLWETQKTTIDLGIRRGRVEVYVHPPLTGSRAETSNAIAVSAKRRVTAVIWQSPQH